jgi:hypothetical protein
MRGDSGFTGPWAESTNAPQGQLRLNGPVNAPCDDGFWLAWRAMIGSREAALALAFALAAGGCGGGDDQANEFREGYNAAVQRLNEANPELRESGQNLSGKSGAEIAREFERVADIHEQTRDRLRNLDPPKEAEDEFKELLAAMDQGVKDIRSAAEAARQEDRERFAEAAEALAKSGEEVNEAERELKEAVDQ